MRLSSGLVKNNRWQPVALIQGASRPIVLIQCCLGFCVNRTVATPLITWNSLRWPDGESLCLFKKYPSNVHF